MQFTTETIAAAIRQNRIALNDLVGLNIDVEKGEDIAVLKVVAIEPDAITLVGESGKPVTHSRSFQKVPVLHDAFWTVPEALQQAICDTAQAESAAYLIALKEQAALCELRAMSITFFRRRKLPDWAHFAGLLSDSPAYMAAHEPGSRRFVREISGGNRQMDPAAIEWLHCLLRRCYRLVYADLQKPRD